MFANLSSTTTVRPPQQSQYGLLTSQVIIVRGEDVLAHVGKRSCIMNAIHCHASSDSRLLLLNAVHVLMSCEIKIARNVFSTTPMSDDQWCR